MKCKRLLLLLLLAIGLPWVANAQESIPYTEGFENMSSASDLTAAGWISYQTHNGSFLAIETSESNVHSGSKALNIDSWDAGSSSDYVVVGLPTVNAAINTLQITFSYKVSTGTVYVGYLTDANDASTFVSLQSFSSSSSYTTKTVELNEAPASAARIAIKYLHWYRCYVDDITVETMPTCFAPQNLTCTEYTATSATLTWQRHANGTENAWVLQYSTDNTFASGVQSFNVSNTPSKELTGLTAETKYYARVRPDCDENLWSNVCEFKPSAAINLTVNDGTVSNSYVPVYGYWADAKLQSEFIIPASSLSTLAGGSIQAMKFYANYNFTSTGTFQVYLREVENSTFSNTTFYGTDGATMVYTGTITVSSTDGMTITFTNEYNYNGGNLLVGFYQATGGNCSSLGANFYGVTSNGSSISMYSTNSATQRNFLPKTTFTYLPSSTPKPTNLTVNNITAYGATVAWQAPTTATPTDYEYQYSADGGTTWTTLTSTPGTSVNLTGLTPNTEYTFQVKANYTEGDSDFAEIQFTTEASCLPVTNITVSDITSNSAKLAWTPGGSETNWQYLTLAHGDTPDWTSESVITSNTHANVPANIYASTGVQPQPNTEYDFYVRANCGGGDYSEAAMLTFRTACGTITSFPWSEDFNSYSTTASSTTAPSSYPNDVMPDCWTFLNRSESSSSYPQVFLSSYSDYAVSGNCLFFKSSYTTPLYAVLPEFGTDIAGLELSFTYRNEGTGTSNGTLYVGYMTDPNDASTFNTENAVTCAQTTSKTPMNVVLPNAPAGSYFAFKYQGGSSNNYYLAIDNITVKVPVFVTANQIVNTVSDPATEMTWNEFVSHWTNGDHFTSTTFTLEDNITVSTMVGTSARPFTGIFNGNSHTITVNLTATDANFTAPFRIIKNATIQNLKVDGTINDDGFKFCAGFAGDCYGNNIFTNCESAVTINATIEGDGTHGGFIARNYGSTSSSNLCTTVFNGCAFTGQLLGASTTQSAGFCGWSEYNSPNYAKTIFNNCLFAPQAVRMSTTNSATFARRRNASYVNFNNCYFMQDFNDGTNNTAQGKQAYTIAGVDPVYVDFSGEHTLYNMSGIDAYTEGMKHGYTKLAGEGEVMTLILDGAAGYEADHGTLVPNGETFTLTMEAYDTQISGVDCPVPYNVAVPAANLTARSAQVTWNGGSDSYTVQYREVITAAVDVNDTYDFEDNTLQGWTTISNDNDNYAWSVYNNSSYAHESSYCVYARYTSSTAGGDANDWLISPQIPLGGTFSFYARIYDASYTDQFQVYVSTTGNNISDFTAISEVITPSTTYSKYEYDLSSYSGNGYVAIVYTAPNNQFYVYVDDITYTNHIDGEYGEWQPVNNAVSPQALESLTPETTYQVKVSGTCASDETDYSDVVEFTTPASCFAPEGLAIVEGSLHAHGVQLSWNSEEGEQFQYCMLWNTPEEPSEGQWDDPSSATTESYEGVVTPNSTYTFFLRKYCGENDYSDFVRLVINVPAGNLPPTDLEANATGANTATATWAGVSTNTYHESYDLYYSTENTMPEEPAAPNLIQGITATSYDLTGLNAATTYYVWVRDYCRSDHNSEWTGPVSFNTECDVIVVDAAHPYTQGFEDSADIPVCWETVEDPWSGEPTTYDWTISDYSCHSGEYSAYSNYYGPIYLIMPDLQLANGTAAQLTFWSYNRFVEDYDKNSVVLLDGENEIELWSPESVTQSWVSTTIDLTEYMGQTIKLAFKYEGDDAHGWYIDDVKVEVLPFTKTIAAVGEEGWESGKGGYYFIASPVAEPVTPTANNGFIVGDYDLYYFDQAAPVDAETGIVLEWINFKETAANGGNFSIVNGKGYLYASKEGTTLTFTGTPGTDGNVPLDNYDGNARFKGWNLIGNPFAQDAYITKPFYTLENSDTYTTNEAGTPIHAMQGVLITAEAEETTVTFTTTAPAVQSGSKLNMNLRRNNKQLDNAILVFGGDQQLGKMTFRENSSKIYMPVEGKDYAITSVEGQVGEVPVSFKAENNGTYSLSFTSEEVSFSYLHLIDNMTGADVNLLQTPSYTFDARTSDYESRFKLVFAVGSSANDETFGFVNASGNFCIFGIEGEATVQVIDVLGHVVSSETFSGSYEKRINGAPGVYMVRLIQGNDVKVQKVVVR